MERAAHIVWVSLAQTENALRRFCLSGQRDLHPRRNLGRVSCCYYTMPAAYKFRRNFTPLRRKIFNKNLYVSPSYSCFCRGARIRTGIKSSQRTRAAVALRPVTYKIYGLNFYVTGT